MQTVVDPSSLFCGRSLVLGLFLGTVLAAVQAAAMGGGSSSSTPPLSSQAGRIGQISGPPTDSVACSKGRVWNAKRRACVRMCGMLSGGTMVDYAYVLARSKRYAEALDVLDLLDD
jgi:hypothetical protein